MTLITSGTVEKTRYEILENADHMDSYRLIYDSRYRNLIAQLDILVSKLADEQESEATSKLRHLLIDLDNHFRAESEFMDAVGYPAASQHRFHHLFIYSNTNDLYRRMGAKGRVAIDDFFYIRLLLLKHIMVQDRRFEEFLEQGRSEDYGAK
ncbi:hypothetical protein RW64_11915 [Geobacter sulfurreducens]|nr:hypothetical protein RW64_11915 [Geobacter sulfurreducens]